MNLVVSSMLPILFDYKALECEKVVIMIAYGGSMSTGSPKLLWTAISTEGAKCNKLYKGPMIHNVKIMCTYYIYIYIYIYTYTYTHTV